MLERIFQVGSISFKIIPIAKKIFRKKIILLVVTVNMFMDYMSLMFKESRRMIVSAPLLLEPQIILMKHKVILIECCFSGRVVSNLTVEKFHRGKRGFIHN